MDKVARAKKWEDRLQSRLRGGVNVKRLQKHEFNLVERVNARTAAAAAAIAVDSQDVSLPSAAESIKSSKQTFEQSIAVMSVAMAAVTVQTSKNNNNDDDNNDSKKYADTSTIMEIGIEKSMMIDRTCNDDVICLVETRIESSAGVDATNSDVAADMVTGETRNEYSYCPIETRIKKSVITDVIAVNAAGMDIGKTRNNDSNCLAETRIEKSIGGGAVDGILAGKTQNDDTNCLIEKIAAKASITDAIAGIATASIYKKNQITYHDIYLPFKPRTKNRKNGKR
ncbi:hypothetical protein HK100_010748 [Physocladia obscura]|uniref:Uncharacterized protein n=1 Tax=Physocladia obscura TaxID=109957 RepID=A0AAD5XIQ7_9FUNG|nr:hypothetical protein HK100_010748 [Physocladia obscura]